MWLFLVASFFFVEIHDRLEPDFDRRGFEWPLRCSFWVLVHVLALLLIAYLVSVKVLLVVLIALGCAGARPRHTPLKLMTYVMVLLGLGVAFAVEIVYIRDFLDNSDWERMNTVFKFYYQVWLLLALGGALIFDWLVRALLGTAEQMSGRRDIHLKRFARCATVQCAGNWLRGVVDCRALVLLAGSSVFLVDGTQARVQDPQIWAEVQPPPGGIQPQGLSLDGMAYMRGWYPGDYAAINWMNEHISGIPTIVEASNGPYAWYGRVSIYTGLPSRARLEQLTSRSNASR